MKFKLLKDFAGIPAGTIIIEDKESRLWYPETDADLQFGSSALLQNNPDWFASFDGFVHDIDEHTWTLAKEEDTNKDYEDLEFYVCSTQGCEATLTQPKKTASDIPTETPTSTPTYTAVNTPTDTTTQDTQPDSQPTSQDATPADNQPA
jgi:hypothetical protein